MINITPKTQTIQTIYLALTLLNTLAASLIWGINTIFLLDAGLTNTQAFAANAFFTLGQVIFEIPTGIVADRWGRRTSYLLGTLTLGISTLLYVGSWYVHAPFVAWIASSVLLGLGFTFFSGATEAWLVDALTFTKFKGTLESVFAKGQIVGGVAMLAGSILGGVIAQMTNIGVPYGARAFLLGINSIVAFLYMKDWGFTPHHTKHYLGDMKTILTTSVDLGVKKPSIRYMMLEAPFSVGVSFYVFYAMQPHLLKLYGNSEAYSVAGLAAAVVAGAQIAGGFMIPYLKHFFKKRTSIILATIILSSFLLIGIGLTTNFPLALIFFILWALLSAFRMPIRQAYLNHIIPSKQRATVLSFDSLVGSSGGVVTQPILGKVADVWSYPSSYLVGSIFQILALPFVFLAKKEYSKADNIKT